MKRKPIILSDLSYILLGLLREQPGSGYEIRRVFETPLLSRYSSSPGSIYPALKKLVEGGLVRREGSPRRGRFAITDRGRRALNGWVTESVSAAHVEERSDILMLKLAFMEGLVTGDERRRFFAAFLDASDELLTTLQDEKTRFGRVMPLHGQLALDHRIAVAETHHRWAVQALAQVDEAERRP